MTRKLSFMLLCFFINIVNADQLSEAIHASNLQKVTELLSHSTITDKQLMKYFDNADQVIRTRQEEINLMKASPNRHIYDETSRKTDYLWYVPVIGGIGLLFFGSFLEYYAEQKLYNKSFPYAMGVIASAFSVLVGIRAHNNSVSEDRTRYRNKRFTLYRNAVRIKELLYDYEISLPKH